MEQAERDLMLVEDIESQFCETYNKDLKIEIEIFLQSYAEKWTEATSDDIVYMIA